MDKLEVGDPAFVVIAGTEYHGEIVSVGQIGDILLYQLDVPAYGVFYVQSREIQKGR